MLRNVGSKWREYRYRLVPWLAFNLKHRRVRSVQKGSNKDKIISDDLVLESLVSLFHRLEDYSPIIEPEAGNRRNMQVMQDCFGFSISRQKSNIPGAGIGVFLASGTAKPGSIVALYPGTVYRRFEPVLLPSIGNRFILRCIDGVHVDGKDSGLSRVIYQSCSNRERVVTQVLSDLTWLGGMPLSPLNVGQYVNNASSDEATNVAYQECNVPHTFPPYLQRHLPNVFYRHRNHGAESIRIVALVATREIAQGEEILSSYFTVVH